MAATQPNFKAGGDINPKRFVVIDATDTNTVVEASGVTAVLVGISTDATKASPSDGASTLAAEDGDHIETRMDGEVALLNLGTGGATAGDKLTSDSDGKGITSSTDEDYWGALALESGSAGEDIEVLIMTGRQLASA